MESLSKLCNKIKEINHQRHPVKYPLDFFNVMRDYLPLGQYMFQKFGWRSWLTFWLSKLFVSDEGGEYDFSAPLLRKFPHFLRKPFKIEIEHTTICNKKCAFCMHTHGDEKQELMSLEQFRHIIDSISGLKWINIAGIGSPFLNRDFLGMVEYSRKKHINVNFVDEFDFLDEGKAKRIIELGVNSIYISFDAAKKETYELMKKGCDYDRSLKNIKTLLSLKEQLQSPFPILHFRYLVTKLNFMEMPDYIELIAALPNRGIRARIEFIGLITFSGIEDYYIPLSSVPENIVRKVYENALKHKINLYFSHSDVSCLPAIDRCVRWAEPFILVNGEVISDCAILMQGKRDFLKSISFGNVFETPFMQIWNSSKYKSFRKQVVSKNGRIPQSCLTCCAFRIDERI